MELKRFHSDGTKTFKKRSLILLKTFLNNGAKKFPQQWH